MIHMDGASWPLSVFFVCKPFIEVGQVYLDLVAEPRKYEWKGYLKPRKQRSMHHFGRVGYHWVDVTFLEADFRTDMLESDDIQSQLFGQCKCVYTYISLHIIHWHIKIYTQTMLLLHSSNGHLSPIDHGESSFLKEFESWNPVSYKRVAVNIRDLWWPKITPQFNGNSNNYADTCSSTSIITTTPPKKKTQFKRNHPHQNKHVCIYMRLILQFHTHEFHIHLHNFMWSLPVEDPQHNQLHPSNEWKPSQPGIARCWPMVR